MKQVPKTLIPITAFPNPYQMEVLHRETGVRCYISSVLTDRLIAETLNKDAIEAIKNLIWLFDLAPRERGGR